MRPIERMDPRSSASRLPRGGVRNGDEAAILASLVIHALVLGGLAMVDQSKPVPPEPTREWTVETQALLPEVETPPTQPAVPSPPEAPPPAEPDMHEPLSMAVPAPAPNPAPAPEPVPVAAPETPPVAAPIAHKPAAAPPPPHPPQKPQSFPRPTTAEPGPAVTTPTAPKPAQAPAVPGSQSAPAAAPEISPAWRSALAGWVRSHRTYPDEARRLGEQGRAVVRFTVDRAGHVLTVTLIQSTGSPRLDAAVQLLFRGASLPPFPGDMTEDEITVTTALNYSLD